MRNNNNKKYKTLLDTGRLLFCLLAFSLLGSLLPTALSLETQTRAISSSGAIMYAANSTLLATDSTPEGPIPYKIDGKSGYQTGSTYTVTAGVHTIELPSPYSSPISNITYYFVYWQDGPTENPRNITLEPNTTVNLHGIYSTTSEPPPPPNGQYLTYTGFESSDWLDQFGLNSWVSATGGTSPSLCWNEREYQSVEWNGETITSYSGDYFWEFGCDWSSGHKYRYTFSYELNGGYFTEVYQSGWFYFPTTYNLVGNGWHDIFEIRDDGGSGRLLIEIHGSYAPFEWFIGMGSEWGVGGEDWRYYITPESETISGGGATVVEWNPIDLPLGRWFRWELYVKRDESDGIFTMWIDGQTLLDVRGMTAWDVNSYARVFGWRWYGMDGWDYLPKAYYVDEVYVYDYNAHVGS